MLFHEFFINPDDPQSYLGTPGQPSQIFIRDCHANEHVGHCPVHSMFHLSFLRPGIIFTIQLSLMFFIVPAFLYCLMFTNLQPRFLMIIYQSTLDNDANFRLSLCKFNVLHYGSLFAIYPLLIFTNFNWVFFIGMSCIVFPQIYANGFNNSRPDVSSPYYTKYLFSRFILIVNINLFSFI